MSQLRFLTIEFMDGTSARYSFPVQAAGNRAVRQVKLDSFFRDRYLILHGEGRLTVFPMENVKSVQLSSEDSELDGIRVPAHTIMGVRQLS
ncbi:MAG: hypothetical protein IT529_22535 [Burkholderiales bacterium]|nr:hypothetical protein [Burkholderiales bacterium]